MHNNQSRCTTGHVRELISGHDKRSQLQISKIGNVRTGKKRTVKRKIDVARSSQQLLGDVSSCFYNVLKNYLALTMRKVDM